MYPHEVQALMAKLIFFIFAVTLLSMGRITASEVQSLDFVQKAAQVKLVNY
jgi:hypothetical protein